MKRCPVCGRIYQNYPAISRRDNHTEICPQCGLREALEDFGMPAEEAEIIIEEMSNIGVGKDRRVV